MTSPFIVPYDAATLENFDQKISAMTQTFDYARLPDVDTAMWPKDVHFFDDISNKEQFNERFIETGSMSGRVAQIIYIFLIIFNLSLFLSIYCFIEENYFYGPERNIYPATFGTMVWMLILCWVCMIYFPPLKIRFNRQAQLVHSSIIDHPLPWRYVQPITNYSMTSLNTYTLFLTFPPLKGTEDEDKPLLVSSAFASRDSVSYDGNLTRFEFIRLYMEHGLSAIRARTHISSEILAPPSGFISPRFDINKIQSSPLLGIVLYLFSLFFYILGYGPLVDWYLKRRYRKFRWPEEVERLCAPGADLSGYDTTPVRARRDFFYRFDGSDIHFVDANGHRIT